MEPVVADHGERRTTRRRRALVDHGILLARVRPGHVAFVIDISSEGALIETAHRLLPNATIELHVETREHRAAVRGCVLRCAVASVRPGGVSYRGAIRFDGPISWLADKRSDGYVFPDAELRQPPITREAATQFESALRSAESMNVR